MHRITELPAGWVEANTVRVVRVREARVVADDVLQVDTVCRGRAADGRSTQLRRKLTNLTTLTDRCAPSLRAPHTYHATPSRKHSVHPSALASHTFPDPCSYLVASIASVYSRQHAALHLVPSSKWEARSVTSMNRLAPPRWYLTIIAKLRRTLIHSPEAQISFTL